MLRRTLIATLAALAFGPLATAQQTVDGKPDASPQWLTILTLARPELYDPAKWTAADNTMAGEHFAYLTDLAKRGVVILGGRTQENDARGWLAQNTLGLVIFEAPDRAAAEAVAKADPAVRGGLMRAEVRSYVVAVQR